MEIFRNTESKIIFGDAIEALSKHVPDSSINLIFADPPYNIGKDFNGIKDMWKSDAEYLEWSYKWIDLCIKKLKPNGSFYVMTSTQFMPYFDIYIRENMEILSRIIWYYDSSGVQAKNFYGSMYEPILFCVKNKNDYIFNSDSIKIEAKTGSKRKLIDYRKTPPQVYNTEKVPGNVWEFSRVRYRMEEYENHPTQKPIQLLERIIKASTNKGDIILDPFAGTFTSGYVAKEFGRQFIGIELQEEYIKIGLRRLEITDNYKGVKLKKALRTFEKPVFEEELKLFEKNNNEYL